MVRKVNLHVLLSDVKVKRLDFLTTMGCRPQESSPPSCQGSRCTIECALPVPRVWQESYGDRLNALSLHGRGGLETETGAVNLALAATLTTSHHRSLLGRHRCELPPRFVDNTREATVADLKDLRSVG